MLNLAFQFGKNISQTEESRPNSVGKDLASLKKLQ